jgi:TPR repeat protein
VASGQTFSEWLLLRKRPRRRTKDDKEGGKRERADPSAAVAQYNLGVMYAEGRGVEKNEHEAVEWFRKAAEQGGPAAQNKLAAPAAGTRSEWA